MSLSVSSSIFALKLIASGILRRNDVLYNYTLKMRVEKFFDSIMPIISDDALGLSTLHHLLKVRNKPLIRYGRLEQRVNK
jgi:hypothetical protein